MALKIGAKNTRDIVVEVKEPQANDKYLPHKLTFEFEVVPQKDWQKMLERWQYLAGQQKKEADEPGFKMPPEEVEEAKIPLHEVAAQYLRNLGPLQDEDGNVIEFNGSVREAILDIPWMQQPLVDTFFATQRGLTMGDFLKDKADTEKKRMEQQRLKN